MQTLLDKMLFELQLRTYAKTTQKHYISHMKRFLKACNKSPSNFTKEDIENFLHSMIIKKNSYNYINISYNAIRFFWIFVLKKSGILIYHVLKSKELFQILFLKLKFF